VAFDARGQSFTMPFFEGAVIRHGAGSKARSRLTRMAARRRAARSSPTSTATNRSRCTPPMRRRAAFGHQRRHRARHRHGLLAHRRRRRVHESPPRAVRRSTSTTERSGYSIPARRIVSKAWPSRPTAGTWPTFGRRRTARRSFASSRFARERSTTLRRRCGSISRRLGSGRLVSLFHLDARFQSGLRRAAVRPELSSGKPAVRRDAAQRRAVAVRAEAQADSSRSRSRSRTREERKTAEGVRRRDRLRRDQGRVLGFPVDEGDYDNKSLRLRSACSSRFFPSRESNRLGARSWTKTTTERFSPTTSSTSARRRWPTSATRFSSAPMDER
jgi:hypothetical protein